MVQKKYYFSALFVGTLIVFSYCTALQGILWSGTLHIPYWLNAWLTVWRASYIQLLVWHRHVVSILYYQHGFLKQTRLKYTNTAFNSNMDRKIFIEKVSIATVTSNHCFKINSSIKLYDWIEYSCSKAHLVSQSTLTKEEICCVTLFTDELFLLHFVYNYVYFIYQVHMVNNNSLII